MSSTLYRATNTSVERICLDPNLKLLLERSRYAATLSKVSYAVWLVLQNGSKNNGINTFSGSVYIKSEMDRKTFASHPFI